MAKLPQGLLGNFYGKVGNIVGYTYKGQQCIRQASRKSTKAPTETQMRQRARFSLAGQFLSPINHFLNRLPKMSKNANSRSSEAMALVQKAIVDDGERLRINYPDVVLCRGHYEHFTTELASCPGGFSFLCQLPLWFNERMETVYFLVYLPEYNYWLTEEADFDGEKAEGTVILDGFTGETTAEVFTIGTYSQGSKATYSFYSGSLLITESKTPD